MTLQVFDDPHGSPVDWWFLYKLPKEVKPLDGQAPESVGTEYLYADAGGAAPAFNASGIDAPTGALGRTLAQLVAGGGVGWIAYNDECPDAYHHPDGGSYGHTKGVLAFDIATDSAFWLLHSWPKFPDLKAGVVPSLDYAQTFLCIQLQGVATAEAIAEQFYRCTEPQIFDYHLPEGIDRSGYLFRLTQGVDVNESDPPCDIPFRSKGGGDFRLLAKNRHWDKDFWIDWVGPQLKVDLNVETWRRGTLPPTQDSDGSDDVVDTLYIDLSSLGAPYEWHYTKDHAKWATSSTPGSDRVCVADINRQTSQEKRGGGTIAFQNDVLWRALAGVEKLKR